MPLPAPDGALWGGSLFWLVWAKAGVSSSKLSERSSFLLFPVRFLISGSFIHSSTDPRHGKTPQCSKYMKGKREGKGERVWGAQGTRKTLFTFQFSSRVSGCVTPNPFRY